MAISGWRRMLAGILMAAALAACTSSRFEPPQVQGPPAMVRDGDSARLWVFNKVEEVRQVSAGSSRRSSSGWRTDTFFHFELQAFDPMTAQPVWKQRLVTYGDRAAKGVTPSRIVGSSVGGQLMGQDGGVVWLLIDSLPWAINAADGSVLADPAGVEQRNPELTGLLPVEARHYAFDRGLVLLAADARRWVIRGPGLLAEDYAPAPVPTPEPELKANGMPRIVPMRPYGDDPARTVTLDGRWLGLFSEKEAADAINDDFGDHLRYPYSITNEGAQARRSFWLGDIQPVERFDERFDRIAGLTPMPGTPSFLKGRFLKDLATGEPLLMQSPSGLLVWHSTRIDSAGRLALTRLDAGLERLWDRELPFSESSTGNPVMYWLLPDRVLVMGQLQTVEQGLSTRQTHLASIAFADGALQGWNLERGETWVPPPPLER